MVRSFALGLATLSLAVTGQIRADAGEAHGRPIEGRQTAVDTLRTRAERTGYEQTSRYADVMQFLEAVTTADDRMHLTRFGYTHEGRALPLVIYGTDGTEPAEIVADGRVRVFVQANIHAGEVCGKEAVLMLLRELAEGRHAEWRDSLILLVAPIYNADGNERVSLANRPLQHGPVGGMGQRPNAQGLDLNRDHMKLESPEARSLVGLFRRFDPHVVVDLHTTNGTRHGYHLTYSPPLHPNTHPEIDRFLRDEWLPEVTRRVESEHGWDFYFYGNVPRDRPGAPERGWYTFDHRPRFNNNYVGLRNRFAILSEAYSYATFQERVEASRAFVEQILNVAHARAGRIRAIVEQAGSTDVRGSSLAVTARPGKSAESVEILLGEVREERNPYSGARMLRMLEVQRPESMPEFGSFEPAATETAPASYLVPADLAVVLERLEAHGIRIERTGAAETIPVERFAIETTSLAEREFQGHRLRTATGRWETVEAEVPAGWAIVRTDQPLGRLAFSLLEPMSDDGLVAWNLFDESLEAGAYPVLRVP